MDGGMQMMKESPQVGNQPQKPGSKTHWGGGEWELQNNLAGVESSVLGREKTCWKTAEARLLHMMKARLRLSDSILRQWVTREDLRGRRCRWGQDCMKTSHYRELVEMRWRGRETNIKRPVWRLWQWSRCEVIRWWKSGRYNEMETWRNFKYQNSWVLGGCGGFCPWSPFLHMINWKTQGMAADCFSVPASVYSPLSPDLESILTLDNYKAKRGLQ